MTDSKTRITADKIEALVKASGLTATPQKGFLRVDGTPGNRIYIALTKTVARIDLSGFEMPGPGYCSPHCGPFGNVKQQVDFTRSEPEILETLKALLGTLASLPPVVKEAKEKKAKSPKDPTPSWSPETLIAREERLNAVRQQAEARKVAASSDRSSLL